MNESSAPPDQPVNPSTRQPVNPSSLRRLVSAAVLFLCFLLILRIWGAEPYEVPTGSMAPTLTGIHRVKDCPRCGYRVMVGRHRLDRGDGSGGRYYDRACCPNCGHNRLGLDQVPETAGDHLLVNKSVFTFRRPRRWETIVFRLFGKAFVKRLIGLPGELLQIIDGAIYIDGTLARKTLEEFKEVRIPVFDMNHEPKPGGWGDRWLAQPPAESQTYLKGTELHLDTEHNAHDYQHL